jgi:hypothetical protein
MIYARWIPGYQSSSGCGVPSDEPWRHISQRITYPERARSARRPRDPRQSESATGSPAPGLSSSPEWSSFVARLARGRPPWDGVIRSRALAPDGQRESVA